MNIIKPPTKAAASRAPITVVYTSPTMVLVPIRYVSRIPSNILPISDPLVHDNPAPVNALGQPPNVLLGASSSAKTVLIVHNFSRNTRYCIIWGYHARIMLLFVLEVVAGMAGYRERTLILVSEGHHANQAVIVRGKPATGQPLKRLRDRENSTLLSAGFEPVGDNLWERHGIIFGRAAALQYARRFADDRQA
jgi:hypothetical protein